MKTFNFTFISFKYSSTTRNQEAKDSNDDKESKTCIKNLSSLIY